jgi:asparagine synthase (glutamine-hydrolysing)
LNKKRAYDYLYYSLTDHTEETLFENVFCLQPGHYFYGNLDDILTQSPKKKIITSRWYVPLNMLFRGTFNEARDLFLERFKEAMSLHLRADVSVGSALSGGLDSSSIVSYVNVLLKQQGKSELQKTFSSCSFDEKYDEKKWIEEVVKATGVESYFVYPDGKDVFNLTEKLVWHMDEPYQSQSVFLGYHVFKKARESNVVVLLNGQGADEYLSGYTDFKVLRQKKLFKCLKIKTLFKELNSFSEFSTIFKAILIDAMPKSIRYFLSTKTKYHKKLDTIIEFKQLVKNKKHPYTNKKYSKSNHIDISKFQLFHDPLQRYLKWEDRNSMAHSVEARVPFLDYRLVEFAQSLPLEFLDAPSQTKKILVDSMKGILVEKVRKRKDKKGFITPEERWLMNDYPEEFIKLIESTVKYSKGIIKKEEAVNYIRSMQKREIEFDYSYWRIIQFCIWMKVFDVQLDK